MFFVGCVSYGSKVSTLSVPWEHIIVFDLFFYIYDIRFPMFYSMCYTSMFYSIAPRIPLDLPVGLCVGVIVAMYVLRRELTLL